MLLREGATVDQANNLGWTPLHIACKYGRVDSARLLLDNGAEVDRGDQRTPRRRRESLSPGELCWNAAPTAAACWVRKNARAADFPGHRLDAATASNPSVPASLWSGAPRTP